MHERTRTNLDRCGYHHRRYRSAFVFLFGAMKPLARNAIQNLGWLLIGYGLGNLIFNVLGIAL